MGDNTLYRDKLILVMGMQRSGTTALLEALGQDPRTQVENEAADGPIYDDYRLRPAKVIHQHLLSITRRVILKPVLEAEHREVNEVFDEFLSYDPLIVWIYRDPIDVWSSAKNTFQLSADEITDWLGRWVRGNESALRALSGPYAERIRSVSYHDLIRHRGVFNALCEFLRLEPRNNLFWREDPKKGHRHLPEEIQTLIAERTSELMVHLDRHRITPVDSLVGNPPDRADDRTPSPSWLLDLGPHHSGSITPSSSTAASSMILMERNTLTRSASLVRWMRRRWQRPRLSRQGKSHLWWPIRDVIAHRRYTTSFWIRSESPVELPLMFVQNHEPYAELERGRLLQVTRHWRHIGVEFFPNADEPDAAMVLDLQGLRGRVEISNPTVGSSHMGLNIVRCHGLNKACLEPIEDDDGGIRIRVQRRIRRYASSIQVELGRANLQAGETYTVALTLRSPSPRPVGVRIRQRSRTFFLPRFRRVIPLTPEWSTYVYEFRATGGDEAQLLLDVGKCHSWVDIKQAALFPSCDRMHSFYLNEGGKGFVEFPVESQNSVRIQPIPGPDAHDADVQITKPVLLLRQGVRYSVSFQARASEVREIGFGIGLSRAPWLGLGLYRHVTVSRDWQPYYYEFIASRDCGDARIHFDLGRRDIPVEIDQVVVQQVLHARRQASRDHLLRESI